MRSPVAPTYLLPDDDTVVAGPWLDGDDVEVGERMDHWDPVTDLELTRTVTVNADRVREQCRLGEDSALALVTSWRCPTRTRLGGTGERVELGTLRGGLRAPISVIVRGPEAGGRLDLTTRLVVSYSGSQPTAISPRRAGTILWTETDRVALEGSAARFPTAAVEFSAVPRAPDNAAWFLDWDPHDLSHPVMGGVRLLLNRSNERIVSAVRTGTSDPTSKTVQSFIQVDVARQMIRAALESDEFIAHPDSFPEGSVGRMVRALITAVWSAMPVDTVRARARNEPQRFEAEIQHALEMIA